MDDKSGDFRTRLHDFSDGESFTAKPPIRVTGSTSPQLPFLQQQKGIGVNKSTNSLNPAAADSGAGQQDGDWLRVGSSLQGSQTSLTTTSRTLSSVNSGLSIPEIRVDEEPHQEVDSRECLPEEMDHRITEQGVEPETFKGITLDIPTGGFGDDIGSNDMKFSNRGSMFINGEKVNNGTERDISSRPETASSQPKQRRTSVKRQRTPAKTMSTDEEMLSEKVRSFYMFGTEDPTVEADAQSTLANTMGLRWQDAVNAADKTSVISPSRGTSMTDVHSEISERRSNIDREGFTIPREEMELAGGLEDWQDVENDEVDRYGFIIAKPPQEGNSGINRSLTIRDQQSIQRVSTSLQMASETPRRKYTLRRSPSSAHSSIQSRTSISRSPSERSPGRLASGQSANLHRHSTLRTASNKLPQNRNRRVMDEASDMLTLPPTASFIDEKGSANGENPRLRKKEIRREEKWRKMAKAVSSDVYGGGMVFEFDTQSPKLIERTWKGIPDRWRATAWHAFLSASAKKDKYSASDEELIDAFHEYQDQSSPDDVQIDIDVPRTINGHIMFRRRYRGGQRLLFRVLHAMSLHFAETGYVQGMAALAATLLAYYEEEKAFVMLVRLWDLRGLDKLYKAGFGGLMAALDDFEKKWLGEGELAKKLENLGIGPTAYGTRWYLTLFNYSIPFPAQLRVWDVFMLLGGDETDFNSAPTNGTINNSNSPGNEEKEEYHFGTTLDILHATSAALIDGMRDILLNSDFENGMKVLTSWIPIKDEDLFMKVAKAEWKVHKRKNGAK